MTTQFALFIADDGQETTFTGSDVLHQMAEHARSFWPDPDLVARGDDEALDAFARDYRHCGKFYGPFFVPVPAAYILTDDEAAETFEKEKGRPPTAEEAEELRSQLADALSETGVWDTLRMVCENL